MNKESITRQAKQILDNFAKSLEKVKISPEKTKQETGGFREESKNPEPASEEFKKRIFSNASETDGDFLIAEKKKW